MPIYPYQTREVRDLAWACFSPPLLDTASLQPGRGDITNCTLPLTDRRRAWLESLDRDARPLLEHLSRQPSRRLGLYFEQLWHFFLAQDREVELLAHNLPVRAGGRTLGEFDIIYFCRRRQSHIHMELAVKFYLGHCPEINPGEPGQWRHWLGPNTRDRLDLKITHLLQRQIRLGDTTAAQELLASLGVVNLQREIEIKGYLFNSIAHPLPPPPGFNTICPMAEWIALPQLQRKLEMTRACSYVTLPRAMWLGSFQRCPSIGEIAGPELPASLALHIAKSQRPQLVAALDASGREISRFFVTGEHWPHNV